MLPGITPALMSAASPGNDQYTVLLLHFDGPNSSTVMPDSSPQQHGNAAVAGGCYLIAGGVIGGAALVNPANGYIAFPNSSDWEFGAGDFTVDWWEYRNVAAGCAVARDLTTTYCPFLLHFGANGEIYMTSTGSNWDIANGAAGLPAPGFGPATLTVWNHFAVTRQGNTFRAFKNGVQKSTWTSSLAIKSNANPLCIGAAQNGQNVNSFMDELRISKGIARWTAPFTPPTKPYGPDYVPPPPPSAANFLVTAPASVQAGVAFNLTVQARDASNVNTTNYSGTVHFTSTDGAAVLPANATLGGGVGTFPVTLKTLGSFTVTATDTVTGSITGSANVTANAMPTIVATATTNNAANTTHSVNLPAGNVGDMLIVFIGGGGITAANGGWTSLDTLSAVYRVATGADALSVTLSGSFTLTAVAYRIRGYAGVPEAVSVTAASVTTIDPPALTPSWGLANNLWFASCIYSYPSAITLTATPANYGDAIFVPPAIGANNSAVYTSTRFLRATSDDPGVFNLSAATQPRGRTVAIRGA